MKIKFEQWPMQGGLYWVAKDERGTAHGAIAASFYSPSAGRPVGEKHLRNGMTTITVDVFNEKDGTHIRILEARVSVCRYRADSDKWARNWLRTNEARAKLLAAIKTANQES